MSSARRSIARALGAAVTRVRRNGARTLGIAAAIGIAAVACTEDFVTGPNHADVTLSLRNWSDTLVMGERRPIQVMALDAKGREVVGARIHWSTATPAVLDSYMDADTSSASSFDLTADRDSIRLAPKRTGSTQIAVSLADPRFGTVARNLTATVVVAGVRLMGAHDTTFTSFGDTSLVRASALARGVSSTSPLVALAGQGLTWTRYGAGAVTLVGTGDSVRAVSKAIGTDTLVAAHAFCLRGARCADTLVVHVTQLTQPFTMPTDTLRAWSLGDTVTARVPVQDARGNAVAGVRIVAVPVTAADSAIIGVNTTVGVPSLGLGVVQSGMTARHYGASQAGTDSPALIARKNGTAHIALVVQAADGSALGSAQVVVVVRQIAKTVHVAPPEAEVTPGDSIPVLLEARDARGHLIGDATFSSRMTAGTYHAGRIVVSAGASAGVDLLHADVTGVAKPSNNPGAPIADPSPDSATVIVRIPPPMPAGDTTTAISNLLTTRVLGPDHLPRAGVWVRFRVPVGSVVGVDSVQSDANGIVERRWLLPTRTGHYTATAFILGAAAQSDTAGDILLRRTSTVVAGPPAQIVVIGHPDTTAILGTPFDSTITVEVQDAYGNPSPTSGIPITVAAGGTGVTLGGTVTVQTDSTGRGTFVGLTGTGSPGSHPLVFTIPGAGGSAPPITATTPPIDFVGGSGSGGGGGGATQVATNLVITSGNGQTGTVAQTLAAQLVVTVTDAVGAPMANVPVTFTPQSGSGSATTPSTLTAVDGTARTTWTIGQTAGAQALAAHSTSLPAVTAAFSATGTPDVPSPITSTMTQGAGVVASDGSVATTVTTTLKDQFGNPIGHSAGPLVVHGVGGGSLSGVTDHNDGTYTVVVTTPVGGSATTVGADIAGVVGAQSVVVPGVSAAPPSLTQTTITASPTSVVVGGTSTITVLLRDAAGNLVTSSGGIVTLATTAGTLSAVSDHGNGSYTATLTAPGAPGVVTISGTLGGNALSATATVSVTIGVASSIASTLSVSPTSLTVGDVATVTVVVRDAFSNVIAGAAPSDFALTATIGSLGTVTCGSGICTATYTGTTAGAASIAAKISGTHMGGSPATVTVSAALASLAQSTIAASPATLVADGTSISTVTVTLRKSDGTLLGASGGTVTLGKVGGGTLSAVTDHGDGTYTATLTAPVITGTTVITASLDGSLLTHASNPASVVFTAGAASLTQSTITASPTSVAPNGASVITVQLIDAHGNALTMSGGVVALNSTSGSLSAVTDHANGSYTATLTAPASTGTITITGTLAGNALTQSATVTVSAGAPSAATSTLAVASNALTVGQTTTVTVVIKDGSGNVIAGATPSDVVLGASLGTIGVASCTGGTCTATYTATTVGSASVSATIGGSHIVNSPATIAVAAIPASLAQSTVAASPTSLAADGTSTSTITVTLRDASGTALSASGGTVTLSNVGTGSLSAVTDHANGTYTATLTAPSTVGSATITASLGGSALTHASNPVTVSFVTGAASLTQSTMSASPTAVTVGGTSTITVQLRDASGNALTTSGGTVALSATAGSLSAVSDHGNGSYTATLTAPGAPGVVTISGTLGGNALSATATVTVSIGAASSIGSTLSVSPTSLTVGDVATVTVVVRDAFGNVIAGAAPSDFTLTTTIGTLGTVTCGSGICTATYTGTTVGAASIAAKISGTHMGGSPATVNVAAAVASLAQSTIAASPTTLTADGTSQSTITVTLRKSDGTLLGASGGTVTLAKIGGGTLSAVTDHADGTYTATLTAPVTVGTATVSASLGGSLLTHASNPVSITFTAGAASLTQSTLVANPTSVAPSGTAVVTVQLIDANGNALTTSGGTVALNTTGGSLSAVTDHANGSYTATLTAPASTGTVTITGTLGGNALTQSATVTVTAGAPSAATSTLTVGANALTIGQTTTVTVVVKDGAGNVIAGATSSDFALSTSLGTLGTVSCAAGTCTATYTATTAGVASIDAKIGLAHIVNSPASITVTSVLTTVQAVAATVLTQGTSYAAFTPVTASGGTLPYAFALSGGTLPSGMTFNTATGQISGTATATLALTTFTVTVTDGASATSSKTFDLTVNPPLVTTLAVPSTVLTVGSSYTPFAPVTATGGTAPLTFALTGGTLPSGVSFATSTGVLSGTATTSFTLTTFTVTVTDAIGASSAKSFTLTVNGPPSAPTITGVTPSSGTLTVTFTAPASDGGTAITNYEYSTDDGATWTTRSPVSAASPIVITGLTDGTTYTVRIRAVNGTGAGAQSASMPGTPATTPSAPSITTVTAGNGQLTVAFTAPSSTGGSAITNYEYSTDNGTSWTTRSPQSTASPIIITGLTNGTTYQVKLRAVNAVGNGTASAPASGTPITVPGAPQTLAATPGTSSASLTWAAPASNGGSAITNYVVEYSANGGGSWSPFAHAPSTATAITVTGLTNGTPYQFRVSATNAAGTGPTSATAAATPGAPDSPTNVIVAFNQTSSTALDGLFSWTAPVNNGGSAITDYVIEYKTSAAGSWTTFAHAASTITSATVPGLLPSTTYNVRISAKNAVGTSPPSAVTTATTVGPSSHLQCFQPGNSNSSANSIVIAPCPGTVAGNVILIPVTIANASTTTPIAINEDLNTTGFTALGTQLNGANQTTIFYKIADAGDVGRVTNYGFTWTGNVKNAISLVAYKTTDGAAPAYVSTSGTGATATAPAVTVSGSTDYTLVYVYTMVGVALSSTTPSVGEWSVSSDLWKNTTAGANNAQAAAISTTDVDKFAPGTTGPRDATTGSMTSTTKWNAAVLVLKAP